MYSIYICVYIHTVSNIYISPQILQAKGSQARSVFDACIEPQFRSLVEHKVMQVWRSLDDSGVPLTRVVIVPEPIPQALTLVERKGVQKQFRLSIASAPGIRAL